MGDPIYLEDLIHKPSHSLIDQSLHAEEAKVQTNGDGFGVGWYGERETPGLYREVLPAWNDPNLSNLAHQIRSALFFAHVRASTGTAISRQNCHPFVHGRWMFMHNGQIGGYRHLRRVLENRISDESFTARQGTTDSEILFCLLLDHGLAVNPLQAFRDTIALVESEMTGRTREAFRMTAALSDGRTVYAVRYASDGRAPTLYYTERDGNLIAVSEPLDSVEGGWHAVPAGHVLMAEPDWFGIRPLDLGHKTDIRTVA